MRRAHTASLDALVVVAALTAPITAQGDVVNFEVHPVEPMALAEVGGRPYLLACNVTDNSVEVYDARTLEFMQRVPVGLRPVTVEWVPSRSEFYTANFLGDSISRVRFASRAPGVAPVASVERTMPTGDEPTDVELSSDGETLLVTLNSSSAIAWHDADTLVAKPSAARITLGETLGDTGSAMAINAPRRIVRDKQRLLVMGQHGGNSPIYDFDLWSVDLTTQHQERVFGLGSTNWNLAAAHDGRYFVVGALARNDVQGIQNLRVLPTGFVQSELYVIERLGTPQWSVQKRDLNRDASGAVESKDVALAAPTDVALLQNSGPLEKVFVCGFSSDRIEVLHPNRGAPATWPSTYIETPNRSARHSRTGPRSLLVARAGTVHSSEPRLLCFNALNQSISVIDPDRERIVGHFELRADVLPEIVRRGREFLYSAEHSGSGFISCSSCHTDGRTDGLGWNLGVVGGGDAQAIPPLLDDSLDHLLTPNFTSDKGVLVTQSLQGLVDHPLDSPRTQFWFSNAPYHWRGDKTGFTDFNEAFVNLQGKTNLGAASDPRGLTDGQMRTYEAFVETIMYPPNPEQMPDRRLSGTLGTVDGVDGTGAMRGMKLYHTVPLLGARSCVGCHWLPEGSNNRLTEVIDQPIETAALRGLLQREGTNELGADDLFTSQKISEFGLMHAGPNSMSINGFISVFEPGFNSFGGTRDVVRFVREFDWGIGPLVGKCFTVDVKNHDEATIDANFDLYVRQVEEANADVVAFVRSSGADYAYVYDVLAGGWREAGRTVVLSTAALRALVATGDDRAIIQATELGAGRRVAHPSGKTHRSTGPVPTNVTLEAMMPANQWEQVPLLTKNWVRGSGPNDLQWPDVAAPEPVSLRTVRIYQAALIAKAPHFGLRNLRHEAPRRFRVAGDDIRHGAIMVLHVPAMPGVPPPYTGAEPTWVIASELYPTAEFTADGRRVWETTVEADPLIQNMLMLGGPMAPDVFAALADFVPEPPPVFAFDPIRWNLHRIQVANEDGGVGDGGWQPLTTR